LNDVEKCLEECFMIFMTLQVQRCVLCFVLKRTMMKRAW
jgi:hypothetical protein